MSKVIGVVFLVLMAACGQASAQNRAEQLEQGCARNDFEACTNLGVMYFNGVGVRQDKFKAVELFTKAAQAGNVQAQNNLGYMYSIGEGVNRDPKEAARLFRLAAERGDASAQVNLAYAYESGQGIAVDTKEAVRLYRLAAEQGNALGQGFLGWYYYTGEVVSQDYVRAYMWFEISQESAHKDVAHQQDLGPGYMSWFGSKNQMYAGMEAARNKLTSAQIEEAKALARDCTASNYRNCVASHLGDMGAKDWRSSVGGWSITTDGNKACFANAKYQNGAVFRIGFDAGQNETFFLFGDPAWEWIKPGTQYSIEMNFDGVKRWSGNLNSSRMNSVPMLSIRNVKGAFIDDFMQRNTLHVSYAGRRLGSFSLRDTFAALTEVKKCTAALNKRPDVQDLVDRWHKENSSCRGASGVDPETYAPCQRRQRISEQLESKGYCYGKQGEAGYQLAWHSCGPTSIRSKPSPQPSTATIPSTSGDARQECEKGVIDPGKDGTDVVVYTLCPEKLDVGFDRSELIETLKCKPNGVIEVNFGTDADKCAGRTPSQGEKTYELLEPLKEFGRVSAAAVRQVLTCRADGLRNAEITIPDAKSALLETRTGATKYEQVSKKFIAQCKSAPPGSFVGRWECRQYFQDGAVTVSPGSGWIETYTETTWTPGDKEAAKVFSVKETATTSQGGHSWRLTFGDGFTPWVSLERMVISGQPKEILFRQGNEDHVYVCNARTTTETNAIKSMNDRINSNLKSLDHLLK